MKEINEYILDLQQTLDRLPREPIREAIMALHEARLLHRQVFTFGNGGSASTASHFVCDLSKNTRKSGWPDFRVLGLADNMATLSAYSNDEGYENVFRQQLASFVQPDDIVIGISTSGNSPNVLEAIKLANQMNAMTIGLTGFDGGQLSQIVKINIHTPSDCIEQVEDIHLMLQHLMVTALRQLAQKAAPPRRSRVTSLEPEVTQGVDTGFAH
jgi:D-sedoheptulose 7-phosphate isomerase